jgi:stearoyl-CoA desaturase (Delta-9 desaturase)
MATIRDPEDELRWIDNIPFWGVHLVALVGACMVGISWAAVAWLAATFFIRMFGITAGYHRYFSHRAYKTSRPFQFLMALLGVTSVQKGPLWWASHHRRHHKYSDEPMDVHSPRQRGFWWSHVGWILVKRHSKTEWDRIKDLSVYPELRLLEKLHMVVVVAFAFTLWLVGGWTALVWGFFVSTTLLWHGTFTVNSLAHVWGGRRYQTSDDSRNNPVIALLTMGEGWHNNHHHYQRSARQGFYWWEVDVSFYTLRALSVLGLVSELHGVPRHVRDQTAAPGRERVAAGPPADPPTPIELDPAA